MTSAPRPLAVSLGDPAGIGPEIIVRAWLARETEGLSPFVVAWGGGVLEAAAEALGVECPVATVSDPTEAPEVFDRAMPVMGRPSDLYRPGSPDASTAGLAYDSLEGAIMLAQDGRAAGVVTAPVSKAGIAAVTSDFTGQTELLADRCGVPHDSAVMMLAGPSLRTVPLTVHVALAEVASILTQDLIVEKARIIAEALRRDFGVDRPRLAIAGLNPHAGEDGKFGDEEQRIIEPAIAALRSEGFDVAGPVPGDALFTPRARQTFDVALCMYHDQALIPLKALEFDEGVNVTLGLPIVRTSPDHGTAFDIAGKGIADPGAMIAALRMASEIAAARARTGQ